MGKAQDPEYPGGGTCKLQDHRMHSRITFLSAWVLSSVLRVTLTSPQHSGQDAISQLISQLHHSTSRSLVCTILTKTRSKPHSRATTPKVHVPEQVAKQDTPLWARVLQSDGLATEPTNAGNASWTPTLLNPLQATHTEVLFQLRASLCTQYDRDVSHHRTVLTADFV